MFPSLNIQKLRYDTIKKLEKEKKDQEDLKKLNEQKQKYQNMMNINHIKKSDSFKQVKEEYYDLKLLEKEFEDFLEYHQSFPKKDLIESHLKDKNNQDITPFILRKEMKYLDELLNHKEEQIIKKYKIKT
jgi:hypothetical protein